MARIKIKQMDDRVATSGIHLGGTAARRKLEPGEVLEFLDESDPLFVALAASEKTELTMDAVTRPLDYPNYAVARYCSPTFRSRGPDEDIEVNAAKETVAQMMAAGHVPVDPDPFTKQPPAPVADSGDHRASVPIAPPPAPVEAAPVEPAPVVEPDPPADPVADPVVDEAPANPRAARRAAAEAAASEENTT